MEVNRIIEIDADSSRGEKEAFLRIRYRVDLPNRSRSATFNTDANGIVQDIQVLTSALSTIILIAEGQGIYKKGQAMQEVIDNLNEMYIGVDNDAYATDKGKRIDNKE